jgi:hypothetical protein
MRFTLFIADFTGQALKLQTPSTRMEFAYFET